MPVKWSICHKDKIVLASAEGETSLEDLEQYILAVAAAGSLPYRKLFDTTYVASGSLRLAELRALSRKVVDLAQGTPNGPIAIVVGSEFEREAAELFGQTDAGRPLAIFSDVATAREWLDRRPELPGSS